VAVIGAALEAVLEWVASCLVGTAVGNRLMKAPPTSFGCALRLDGKRWRNGLMSVEPGYATWHRRTTTVRVVLPLDTTSLSRSRRPRWFERLVLHGGDRVVAATAVEGDACELASNPGLLRHLAQADTALSD
jgi:hypothetical protein